jgi:hypothetical protein
MAITKHKKLIAKTISYSSSFKENLIPRKERKHKNAPANSIILEEYVCAKF